VRINRHSDNHSDSWELENYREVLFTLHRFYESEKISKDLYEERCLEFHYKLGSKYWKNRTYLKAIKEFFIILKLKSVIGKKSSILFLSC